ncbi:MAG TPA: Ig-like domain-containing protein, partial [Vicinamibacterales bacterium]|nr:Ig-like domain-containing protein [Vicinamibacterales bacterium]
VAGPTHGALSGGAPALTYTPAAGYNGSDSFTFKANDGQADSNVATVSITIAAVNDAPSFVKGANVSANEDAGAQTVNGWATAISAGPADETPQILNFVVSNNNNSLFSVQPAISANGTLTYKPAASVSGTATVTVSLHDNGGTANGGADTSAAQTFVITINAVNDVPTFTPGPNQTVTQNSGAKSAAWATGISAGANESAQVVNFIVTNSNTSLFSAQPAISANGTLTFTPATGMNGSATVTVTLHDNGGTANGGIDTSAPVTFVITVTPINRPPVAVADTATTTFKTPVTINVLANDSDPDGNTLTIQSVSSCSNNGSAVIVGSQIRFTPSSDLTRGETDTFTYTISDGKGGTATATVSVTIINSAPVAVSNAVTTFKGEPIAINVLANDSDADRDRLTVISTTAPAHGTRSVSSNGTITYTPVAGYEGTDSFTYTISDGNGGTATATITVTMTKHFDGDGCSHDSHRNGRHDDDDSDHDRDTRGRW